MENNKFDKRTMNIRTGLGLVGIQVDLKVAYLIDKFMIAFNEEGSGLTLDELTDIKFKAEKFFDSEVAKFRVTLDDLKGVAINCKTRQESDEVLKLFDKLGIVWDGVSPCNMSGKWEHLQGDTCYTCSEEYGVEYDEISYYKSNEFIIKPAKWFLENFTPKDKEE